MPRSENLDSTSDIEVTSLIDNEEEKHWQDEFNQEPKQKIRALPYGYNGSNDSDDSLYNRCWQRAQHYVQEFIKEQDAADNDKSYTDATSSRREEQESEVEEKSNYQNNSSRSQQMSIRDRSDTEYSLVSQWSSDESKTYSEVYSEIYEESKAREKKAENICKVYKNNNRTRRWVEHIGQSDIDDCTTEASERSDKQSEESFHESNKELDYKALIKEQLNVIAQYQKNPLGSLRNCIEDYIEEIKEARNVKEKEAENNHQFEEKARESYPTYRSNRSNILSIKSYTKTLDFESKSSRKSLLVENDLKTKSTEILQFEHCEIYHVKQSDKCSSKDKITTSVEDIPSSRSKYSLSKKEKYEDTKVSDNSVQNVETIFKPIKEQISQDTELTANQLEVKRSYKDRKSQRKFSNLSESSEEKSFEVQSRQTSEIETKTSQSYSNHIELKRSLKTCRRLHKSERASNNSHKSNYLATSSSCSSSIRSPYENSSDSNKSYYFRRKSLNSSSSQISSQRSRKDLSGIMPSKSFEDRACSPIKIKSSRSTNPIINQRETEEDDNVDSPETSCSSKTKLNYHNSQFSITSFDKGLQYPSETELEESIKSEKSSDLKIPSDFKGNAIKFDNEDELLDISDRKKDSSSRNSSYNSIPSADRSSICSISSYEPSERFYRRTQPEDDDDNYIKDTDDSEPMTYKKHVKLLAEKALRNCTNYYNEAIKLNPDLDQILNEKVQLLYNSEMRFNVLKKEKKKKI